MFKTVPFVYSLNCNIVSLGYVRINANKNWCSRFLVTQTSISSWCLDAGELLHVWKCWELRRLRSRSCILLRSHMPAFNPRWGEAVLEVYCSWFRRKNIREVLYDVEEPAVWLHSSVQASQSRGSSHISTFTPLCCGVGNDFRLTDWCQGGISSRRGGKRKRNVPLKSIFFFQCIFSSDNKIIVFLTV